MYIGFVVLNINDVREGDQSLTTIEKKLSEALQKIDELEKRGTVTEDIEEIKRLKFRYVTGHTFNDGDIEAESFADDATLEIAGVPVVGKEAITKYARDTLKKLKIKRDRQALSILKRSQLIVI